MTLNPPKPATNGQYYTDPTSGRQWQFDSSVGTEGVWRSVPAVPGGLPAGSIMPWPSDVIPANWALMNGQAISRVANASLFALIGTTHGAGDGSTTFNVPDWRGRGPMGKNSGTFATLGATGGAETHLLTAAESGLPAHNHNPAVIVDVTTLKWSSAASGTGSGTLNSSGGTNNVFTGTAGPVNASAAHNNLQPYAVANWIIKTSAGFSPGDSELATRLGVLEAAPAGLVRVVPTSVAVGSGSASVSSTGVVTFTGANQLTLNGVFSSAYRNYRVIFTPTANSGSGSIDYNLRFTVAGVGNSTTNYFYGGYTATQTTVSAYPGYGQAQIKIGAVHPGASDAWMSASVLEIFRPADSSVGTTGLVNAFGWDGPPLRKHDLGFVQNQKLSFDGITIWSDGNTNVTGTIQVYGYRN